MTMALSKKSIQQAQQVKEHLIKSNARSITTRMVLDRIIELVKFPYLKDFPSKYSKGPVYTSQQYDPIRKHLIESGFLSASFDGYRYTYIINR